MKTDNKVTDNVREDENPTKIIVWANGTYKFVEGTTWEYEHDKDYLVTIPLSVPQQPNNVEQFINNLESEKSRYSGEEPNELIFGINNITVKN